LENKLLSISKFLVAKYAQLLRKI